MRSLQSSLIILTFIAGLASADIGGEEKPKLSINALSWLAGQRQGPHDDGLLEQTWLAPRSGTVTALVRSSEESATRFVEIIHVREINGSLELNLQIFNNSLEPDRMSATHSPIQKFELTEIGDRYVFFRGVSSGAHRSLSYQLSDENIFFIRIETNVGEKIEVELKSILVEEKILKDKSPREAERRTRQKFEQSATT